MSSHNNNRHQSDSTSRSPSNMRMRGPRRGPMGGGHGYR